MYERILYSWDINDKSDYGYGWSIEYKNENWDFDLEKFKDWVYSSKDSLKPWMRIHLDGNNIWYEWVKILAGAWKDSLKPWITISLWWNKLWYKWAKILAKTWKDKLKPWMKINLVWNNLWYEWVKILAEAWKDKIQPWMTIDLWWNEIWKEWVIVIMQNLKLKEWVSLNFIWNNEISDEMKTQLNEWVQWYRDQWIEVDCGGLL